MPILPIGEVESAYYLRLSAVDQPGVLADVTRILADHHISIEAILQKEPPSGETQLPVIILTHQVIEKDMNAAIDAIEALPTIGGNITRIRVETLG